MAEEKSCRFRISIPKESEQILEWIRNQSNLSYAFMFIIRDWIAKYGTENVFAQHIERLPKRGRPSNVLKETVTQMQGDDLQESAFDSTHINGQALDDKERIHQSAGSEQMHQQDVVVDDDGFFDFEQSQNSGNMTSKSIIDMMNSR